jgi:hypothetical protein
MICAVSAQGRARTASLQARIPEADRFAFRDSRAYLDRMSSSAFIFDRLRAADVDESRARAHAEALDVALRDGVASKADIDRLETKQSVISNGSRPRSRPRRQI